MNKLNDYLAVRTDIRRIELARLLALGVIRALAKRRSPTNAIIEDSGETSKDRLEES